MLQLHSGKSSYKEKKKNPQLLPGDGWAAATHPAQPPAPFSRSEELRIAGEEMDHEQFGGNRERKKAEPAAGEQQWQIIAVPRHCPLPAVL